MTRQRQTSARATLRDVADAAGVSVSTASLVFSGKGPVAAATAERVRSAAAALGYAGPDPIAASLRHGRAGVIGVSVDAPLRTAFQDPFAVAMLDGISTVLDEVGSGMLLMAESTSPHGTLTAAIDAMIFPLCGLSTTEVVQHLAARGIPMVAASAPSGPGIVHLKVSEADAMRDAAAYVKSLGHQRIGHLTMNLGDVAGSVRITPADVERGRQLVAVERARGFLQVCGKRAPMAQVGSATVEASVEAAGLLLDLEPHPTAIVAQSDLIAAGVLRAAAERGLSVPEDLSVVGFDGIDLPWFSGVLTTVDQDAAGKGRALARMAIELAAGKSVRSRRYPTTLRIGTTTAPPKGGSA